MAQRSKIRNDTEEKAFTFLQMTLLPTIATAAAVLVQAPLGQQADRLSHVLEDRHQNPYFFFVLALICIVPYLFEPEGLSAV